MLADDAEEDAPPAALNATTGLAESEVLRSATSVAFEHDEVLLDALELGHVARIVIGGEPEQGADLELGEAADLTDEELAVLRQFVLLFGVGHLTALVIVLAAISGVGFVTALGVLSAVATLSGYSLRDLLKGDD